MKFQCLNPECKKAFVHPAKKTESLDSDSKALAFKTGELIIVNSQLEMHICPYCQSLDFTEYIEPELVESVYIYELGTGRQDELHNLLAEGWKIVARYARQYYLEKLKEVKE